MYLKKAVGEAWGLMRPLTLFWRLFLGSPQIAPPSTGKGGRYGDVRGLALANQVAELIFLFTLALSPILSWIHSLALKVEYHQGPDLISQRYL